MHQCKECKFAHISETVGDIEKRTKFSGVLGGGIYLLCLTNSPYIRLRQPLWPLTHRRLPSPLIGKKKRLRVQMHQCKKCKFAHISETVGGIEIRTKFSGVLGSGTLRYLPIGKKRVKCRCINAKNANLSISRQPL